MNMWPGRYLLPTGSITGGNANGRTASKTAAQRLKGGSSLRQQGAASALDPSGGRWPLLSVPVSRRPRRVGGRWDVIDSALDSWPRTFRLCLILLVTVLSPVAAAMAAELIRHML
jgi:hypothetical protein